ncbi:putative DNA methylase [Dietzia cinnamea P4]|nr:putative DNA methylase [Dietzia cinnamea P4]
MAQKMGRRWVTCELLESNFATFTLPRLTKVVRGDDPGGITTTPGERVDATDDGLPGDLSAAEAFGITQSLSKASKIATAPVDLGKVVGDAVRADAKSEDPVLSQNEANELRRLMRKLAGAETAKTDFLPYVRKAVGDQLKTKKSPETINWRGGGGFQVAYLSPTLFDYEPELGLVTLCQAAFEGDNLARGVAAHLNFHLTPEHQVFTGKRGRTRLLVTTVTVTPGTVRDLVNHLAEGENLVIASTAIDPESNQAIRECRKGSRVLHVPNDLFRVNEIEAE